jgi:hypothetical protein
MFGKKSKKSEVKMDGWQDKAAGKIAHAAVKVQRKFSMAMNKIFHDMPVNKVKIFFALLCLASGGYSIYLAAHAVFGPSSKMTTVEVENVRVPQYFDQKDNDLITSKQSVTGEMYQEIQGYKRYMDSMGRPIRQSLLDSIILLEEIYHSQTTK